MTESLNVFQFFAGFFKKIVTIFKGRAVSGLRINISRLAQGTHHWALETEPVNIGLDTRFNKTVKVQATLEKTSRQLYLQVEFTTGGLFTCDRCLDEFQKNITNKYKMVYVSSDQAAKEVDRGEIQIISLDTSFIDLGEDVRQYSILALPQKLLCQENCEGLCPTCGTNLNRTKCECQTQEIDSPWEVLKNLFEN